MIYAICSLGALSSGQAGDLVAVFLLLLDHLAFAQIVAGTPNGDELPASAETGLFGGGLFALEEHVDAGIEIPRLPPRNDR